MLNNAPVAAPARLCAARSRLRDSSGHGGRGYAALGRSALAAALGLAALGWSSAPEDSSWYHVRSEEGRFEVRLPAEPSREERSRSTLFGKMRNKIFEATHAGRRYTVEFFDLPGIARWVTSDATILERAREGLLDGTGGELIENHETIIEGQPGQIVLYRVAKGDRPRVAEARFVLAESRLYQVATDRSSTLEEEPAVRKFFDSFKIWLKPQ